MNHPSKPKRKGVHWLAVLAGLAALFALAGGAALFGYFYFIRYERVAARHLPADTTAALRLDLEKVILFEPVRKHLFPLFDELGRGGQPGMSRARRLEDKTGVNIGIDCRELVLAQGPTSADWVLLVGGRFKGRNLIGGLGEVLREDGIQVSSEQQRLVFASGIAAAQAEDGTLVVAANRSRLESSLPEQQTYERLGLAPEGPGGFAVDGRLLREVASSPAAYVAPALRDLESVERITATLALGPQVTVDGRVAFMAQADVQALEERGRALLLTLSQLSSMLPGQDLAGERAALERASIEQTGERSLRVVVPWTREDIDRGAQALAAAVRAVAAAPESPAIPARIPGR
jgi:hypothetical protein